MELWIRSQDKECLMKVDRLDYDLSSGVHQIKVNGYQTLVGKYKSKERALEVLEEIQGLLTPRTYIKTALNLRQDDIDLLKKQWENVDLSKAVIVNKGLDIQPLGFIVYQMPEE